MMTKQAMPKTLQEAIVFFSNPENCREYMAARRWPNGVICPTCGRNDVTFLAKQNKWQCKSSHAKRQFSVKVGTIFEDSPLGLDKWLMAVWMITNCKNGVSSYEIHRAIGVTQKTAWFMVHRLRLAMQTGSFEKKMSGEGTPVEADKTFIGGMSKNMHRNVRERRITGPGGCGKAIVFGLLKRRVQGTYVSVEPFHLFRYLDEQTFRFNERKGKDADRFAKVTGQLAGKRLTYDELTGKLADDKLQSH